MYYICVKSDIARKGEDSGIYLKMLQFHIEKLFIEL